MSAVQTISFTFVSNSRRNKLLMLQLHLEGISECYNLPLIIYAALQLTYKRFIRQCDDRSNQVITGCFVHVARSHVWHEQESLPGEGKFLSHEILVDATASSKDKCRSDTRAYNYSLLNENLIDGKGKVYTYFFFFIDIHIYLFIFVIAHSYLYLCIYIHICFI